MHVSNSSNTNATTNRHVQSPPNISGLLPGDVSIEEEFKISIGHIQYLLIPHQKNFLNLDVHNGGPILILVYLIKPGDSIFKSALQAFRTNTLERDDVFQPEFYRNVIFYGSKKEDIQIDFEALQELMKWNTKTWTFVEDNPEAKVPPGPYVIARGQTWQPWKVYYDFNATFLITLDSARAGTNGRVIVPSRCYFNPTKSRPLDGARISVKDNFDIAGHKTSLCNRAWAQLYPAKTRNAVCVQTLLDAGAIIVGKAKLQAMIMREEPLECVEFIAPFNPRGDGYQVPSGSSNGSAAGVGSYDWLDFSLGSDTNGSGRKPAHYNGCFSIRPSTGIINTDGVIGSFAEFDMPVFFGRDISRFPDFISVWYGGSPMLRTPKKMPVKILYPLDYLPTSSAPQSRLIDKFIEGLEIALEVTRIDISLTKLWEAECPDGQEHADLAKYLELAGAFPYFYDGYYALADFRNSYMEKFGKPAFVHRALHWQWNIAKKISQEQRDMLWRRSNIYRQWLLDRVFNASSNDSVTIMILPIEVGMPNYRDSEPPPSTILSGYSSLNMSPIMRAPELTAIVGEITYQSTVTKREEPMPIGVSIIGAPGTDLILADLVEMGMKAKEIPTKLKTGPSVY